jgi:sec-independent protein translocase protein TatB
MFDFSFSELMVVMVVALIVIGPERLPKVARTLGHLWGRATLCEWRESRHRARHGG